MAKKTFYSSYVLNDNVLRVNKGGADDLFFKK